MDKGKPKRKLEDYIDMASDRSSDRAAEKVVRLQYKAQKVNHYHAMENLLREYKKHRWTLEHTEEFDFFPRGKSKDISVAPPPGSGMVDKIDLTEAFVRGKTKAFEAQVVSWYMADMVIRQFENREEFIVIRMYYFNEDSNGVDRGEDAKRYTWEEIADELSQKGVDRSITTLRMWRSNLLREMTVLLFGVDGALSIESHDKKHGQGKEKSDE